MNQLLHNEKSAIKVPFFFSNRENVCRIIEVGRKFNDFFENVGASLSKTNKQINKQKTRVAPGLDFKVASTIFKSDAPSSSTNY